MKLKWKLALPVLALLILSALLTTGTSYFTTKSTVDHMVDDIIESNLDTLVSQVERARETEQIISGEMDKKNLALTRAFAEIVRLNAVAGKLNPQDTDYFQIITDMLDVSEVHITDSDGVLIGGNIQGYFGFDFRGTDQTIPFLRILDDPSYELAQEPQPSGSEGKLFQYIGTARTDEKGIVQVGFDAQVIAMFRDLLDVSNTAQDIRVGSTGHTAILQDGVIIFSQTASEVGQDVSSETWYKDLSSGRGKEWITMNGDRLYAGFANTGGMTLLVLFPQSEYNSYLSPVINIAFVGLAIAILITVIVYYLVSRSLKPLVVLSEFMLKAGSTGDINLRPEDVEIIGKISRNKDEIGQAVSGSASFVQHIANAARELETVAGGDLTSEIKQLSETDTIGKSLKEMIETLNRMFSEINSSAVHVSFGSKQIADGSQALAQGTTEQAASIEELSSSIAEIAGKTKENAVMAEDAVKLSDTIRLDAEEGSRRMDEMITAVREINEASRSIEKIIKTIDDIAFQTNILALNAAVEAARAGQHGKGFAVVAEEVRNLASKSAQAAKNTGDMIQNSMAKAELGSRIAADTAESLSKIATGINESTQLITKIAKASDDQSSSIAQVNVGIDQVAQVIQQNSATAEESAASSQEMSSQSSVLQQLISQFRLKDGGSRRSLPPSSGNRVQRGESFDTGDNPHQFNSDGFGKY